MLRSLFVISQKFRKAEISLDTGFKNFGAGAESESEKVTTANSCFCAYEKFLCYAWMVLTSNVQCYSNVQFVICGSYNTKVCGSGQSTCFWKISGGSVPRSKWPVCQALETFTKTWI